MSEKLCKKCGQTKPIDEFWRDSGAADGRQYWCKVCMAVAIRKVRVKHQEANRAKRAQTDAAKAGGDA